MFCVSVCNLSKCDVKGYLQQLFKLESCCSAYISHDTPQVSMANGKAVEAVPSLYQAIHHVHWLLQAYLRRRGET